MATAAQNLDSAVFSMYESPSRMERAMGRIVGDDSTRGSQAAPGAEADCVATSEPRQSLPRARISSAAFVCSGVISGGPGLTVMRLIVPVKRNGTW